MYVYEKKNESSSKERKCLQKADSCETPTVVSPRSLTTDNVSQKHPSTGSRTCLHDHTAGSRIQKKAQASIHGDVRNLSFSCKVYQRFQISLDAPGKTSVQAKPALEHHGGYQITSNCWNTCNYALKPTSIFSCVRTNSRVCRFQETLSERCCRNEDAASKSFNSVRFCVCNFS